ncbi:hypothetical protein WN51_13903 [Melipona quadrifasciata]|uniref:Uncharacterized protein n=1 Tax=Melipona quadrifasciata TaxID=166423 RepID=A0A0M8ZYQ6_9HYME|nr:hypothetical protein WN51_13903 [Melipona quadrifasciata]
MQAHWRQTIFHPDITSIAIEIQGEYERIDVDLGMKRRGGTKGTEKGRDEGGKKSNGESMKTKSNHNDASFIVRAFNETGQERERMDGRGWREKENEKNRAAEKEGGIFDKVRERRKQPRVDGGFIAMRPRCGHDAVAVISGCIPAGIPLRISSFAIGSTGTGYVTGMLEYPAGRVAAEHVRPPPRRPGTLSAETKRRRRGDVRDVIAVQVPIISSWHVVSGRYTLERGTSGLAIGSPLVPWRPRVQPTANPSPPTQRKRNATPTRGLLHALLRRSRDPNQPIANFRCISVAPEVVHCTSSDKKKKKEKRSHDKSHKILSFLGFVGLPSPRRESIENTSPSFQEHLHPRLAKTRKEDFKADYWRPLKTTSPNIDQPEGDLVSRVQGWASCVRLGSEIRSKRGRSDLGLARGCGRAAEARARASESLMVQVEAANPPPAKARFPHEESGNGQQRLATGHIGKLGVRSWSEPLARPNASNEVIFFHPAWPRSTSHA